MKASKCRCPTNGMIFVVAAILAPQFPISHGPSDENSELFVVGDFGRCYRPQCNDDVSQLCSNGANVSSGGKFVVVAHHQLVYPNCACGGSDRIDALVFINTTFDLHTLPYDKYDVAQLFIFFATPQGSIRSRCGNCNNRSIDQTARCNDRCGGNRQ